MSEVDDDVPQLSAETFVALQEFYKEQAQKEEKLKSGLTQPSEDAIPIDEDWQLSQFWYDENTVNTLVMAVLKCIKPNSKIALISCPTLYQRMKHEAGSDSEVSLFEYDQRFALYGSDFILYDYKSPLDIPRNLSSYYDIVIADPPFLSEECLTKTAVTMKFLTKGKLVLCTGAIMADLAERLLDVRKCHFKPGHVNNLANEFCCYANFNLDAFIK
ncbi:hypothetical protein ILUMI_22863 [Ignelater luminosus]|uniref:Protein-lysine N-methyltransferase ILUMI_22863 n=1 Tax=Ignelater luminosus TaxID=2038154 RepID=A0A8K0G2G6_IGNLU|nr:hypothetical protein ILUMI_22863 [Ignelater luminosus]